MVAETVILEVRTSTGYVALELWEHRYADGRVQLYGKVLSGQLPARFQLVHGDTEAALVLDGQQVYSDGAYRFMGVGRGS